MRISAKPSDEVVVIDEKLARDYFADGEPTGQRIRFDAHRTGTIVGVVSSLRNFEQLTPVYGRIYLPRHHYFYINDVVLRTDGEPLRLADAVRTEVKALDADQAVSKIEAVDAALATATSASSPAVTAMYDTSEGKQYVTSPRTFKTRRSHNQKATRDRPLARLCGTGAPDASAATAR